MENPRDSITQAAQNIIPKQHRKRKKEWMTAEILDLIEKRRKRKEKRVNYEDLQVQITIKCEEAKEKWLEERCENIEQLEKKTTAK